MLLGGVCEGEMCTQQRQGLTSATFGFGRQARALGDVQRREHLQAHSE